MSEWPGAGWLAAFALAPAQALQLTSLLWALSGLVQAAEFLRLRPALAPDGLWSWSIHRDEFAGLGEPALAVFDRLYLPAVWRLHLVLRLVALGLLALTGPSLWLTAFLLAGTMLILLRWRGAFNGGSDFMTLVVISGLFIGECARPWVGDAMADRAGLAWIAIHSLSSYFLSGAVKLGYRGWRNGQALAVLLDTGLHGPLPADSRYRQPVVAMLVSWVFIVWESIAPVALAGPTVALVWCLPALGFHVLVFRYFGLNRFVWAWAASLPAIMATADLSPLLH
jgi:hypothetical protein